jgi:cbb3-type cytochrome oxidase subunit 3
VDFAALFHIIQSWGPSAISSCLVVVVLYLIRRVDRNSEEDARRAKTFQDQLETKVGELRADMGKVLDDYGKRLLYVEKEYTRNEVFFQNLSGWRAEIGRLSDQISTHFMAFTQNIIQVLNRGKHEG